jgi:hypothetical protein
MTPYPYMHYYSHKKDARPQSRRIMRRGAQNIFSIIDKGVIRSETNITICLTYGFVLFFAPVIRRLHGPQHLIATTAEDVRLGAELPHRPGQRQKGTVRDYLKQYNAYNVGA